RATHWAVWIPGLLCGLSAWAMSVSAGPGGIVQAAQTKKTDLVFALVAAHLPEALISMGYLLFLTSVSAALLAFHAAVARYQFALGRGGVLPQLWGRTHPRTGAPIVGSITQSLLALGVLVGFYWNGADPLLYLFAQLTIVGGLGVLILMWAASAAVIVFFLRNRGRENVWRGQVAPVVAFLLLSAVLLATVIGLGDLLQAAPGSPLRWLYQVGYAIFAVFGFGWALIMRGARPEVYAAIGRGAEGHLPGAAIPAAPRGAHVQPEPAMARAPA